MKILIAIAFCFSLSLSQAQNFPTAADVNNAFTTEELHELIKNSAYEAVKEYRVPQQVFDINYARIKNELLEKAKPAVRKQTRWMMSTGGTSDLKTFKKQIYRGVRDIILFDPAFKSLGAVDQTDRILKYYSEIKVKKDGWLEVTEHITIYNGDGEQSSFYMDQYPNESSSVNNDIQHGLARDFPTIYQNKLGLQVTVPFVVKNITLNGNTVHYGSVTRENGVQLRIGSADSYLEQGVFAYIISYETKNQLIFHPDKDELYWNVNGNGWVFTADSVMTKITFPAGSKIFDESCATGLQDSKARNCISKKLNDSTIYFSANAKLNAYEGLTVSASIQKGLIQPPAASENVINIIKSNWPLPAMVGVILFLFSINMRNWLKYGRDPKQGTIIPQFEPPLALSPADVGFIYNQGYKTEQFSAALVDIAVRKGITIEVEKEGLVFKKNTYRFNLLRSTPELEEYITRAYDWSLDGLSGLKATGTYNPEIASLNGKLNNHLTGQFQIDSIYNPDKKGFFRWNAGAGVWGFFFLFILGFVSLVVLAKKVTITVGIVVALLFLIAFIMQYVFYKIMPAYTKEGRKVLDEILGFKMYLTTAEEKRFNQLSPPEKTLSLFEKYLPYAISLECQNEWSNKFENILNDAITNNNYRPTYYSGDMSRGMSISSMSSSLSEGLSGTISSSSTAPSSSSGGGSSSGGSSSGGGGGGGGGGGW